MIKNNSEIYSSCRHKSLVISSLQDIPLVLMSPTKDKRVPPVIATPKIRQTIRSVANIPVQYIGQDHRSCVQKSLLTLEMWTDLIANDNE